MINIHFDTNQGSDKFVQITSDDSKLQAIINLSKGGSISNLILEGHELISEPEKDYKKSFDSAILFPFPNRIQGSQYNWDGLTFHLKKNLEEEDIAIHGLVYNKEFEVKDYEVADDSARIIIKYESNAKDSGFPYLYELLVAYTFKMNQLNMEIVVINQDEAAFPFSLGWHPYFRSRNLADSTLTVNTTGIFVQDHFEGTDLGGKIQINNKKFDDCFMVKDNSVLFETPDYDLKLTTNQENFYVQLYTPESRNSLAIEPMTAPPNSLNNKIDLLQLQPSEKFKIEWTIDLTNIKTNNANLTLQK